MKTGETSCLIQNITSGRNKPFFEVISSMEGIALKKLY